ncbi:MAG: hypothetical protein KG003_10405 [Bacteroidetes bacterium]|nr:hypothetical protein [Bacteroidota bacterium]
MKRGILIVFFAVLSQHFALSCDACEKQQPAITRGITHGNGPNNNWDWVIVIVMVVITLVTLCFSIWYLIRPGENQSRHIKRTILNLQ